MKFHGIVLRVVRHTDRSSLCVMLTRERGRLAVVMPSGKGRTASRFRALTYPLSMVECVADMPVGADVGRMVELVPLGGVDALMSNPVKCALSMMLAEVLECAVRYGGSDAAVWQWACHSLSELEGLPSRHLANFHICFMLGLSRAVGIMPDVSEGWQRGLGFDMVDGVFRMLPVPGHRFVDAAKASVIPVLARLHYRNMHMLKLTPQQRADLLDALLDYVSLHHSPVRNVRCLDVLRTLF